MTRQQRPIFRTRAKPRASRDDTIDKWLVRLSHLSQFGLLLFTVGTIYFTVIPLYQKALLEEAIAKREIELRDATALLAAKEKALTATEEILAKLDSDLAKTRDDLARAQLLTYVQQRDSSMFDLVFRAGADCTGLFRRPVDLDLDAPASRKARYEEDFELAPGACLQQAFQKSKLKAILKESDRRHLEKEISGLMAAFHERRNAALKASNALPEAAKRDPKLLRPPGPYVAQTEAFLARARAAAGLPPARQTQEAFERAVTRTRDALSAEYLDSARQSIRNLRDTAWPIKITP